MRYYNDFVKTIDVVTSSRYPVLDLILHSIFQGDIQGPLVPNLHTLKFSARGTESRRYLPLFLSPSVYRLHLNFHLGDLEDLLLGLDLANLDVVTLHHSPTSPRVFEGFINGLAMSKYLTHIHFPMHMPVDSGLLQTLLCIKPLRSLALNVGSMPDATLESVILHDEPIRPSELYITLPSVTYIQNFISFLQKIQTNYLSIVALHIFLPLGVTHANLSNIFLTVSRFSLLSTLTIHFHAFPDSVYSDDSWIITEPPL